VTVSHVILVAARPRLVSVRVARVLELICQFERRLRALLHLLWVALCHRYFARGHKTPRNCGREAVQASAKAKVLNNRCGCGAHGDEGNVRRNDAAFADFLNGRSSRRRVILSFVTKSCLPNFATLRSSASRTGSRRIVRFHRASSACTSSRRASSTTRSRHKASRARWLLRAEWRSTAASGNLRVDFAKPAAECSFHAKLVFGEVARLFLEKRKVARCPLIEALRGEPLQESVLRFKHALLTAPVRC